MSCQGCSDVDNKAAAVAASSARVSIVPLNSGLAVVATTKFHGGFAGLTPLRYSGGMKR